MSLRLKVLVLWLLTHRHACALHCSVPCVFAIMVMTDSCTAEVHTCMWVVRVGHECPTLTTQTPRVYRVYAQAQVVPDTRFVLLVIHLRENDQGHASMNLDTLLSMTQCMLARFRSPQMRSAVDSGLHCSWNISFSFCSITSSCARLTCACKPGMSFTTASSDSAGRSLWAACKAA